MQMVQYELQSGSRQMVSWLPRDSRVKVGSIISLDRSSQRWRVISQFSSTHQNDIQRGWKVGGIA